MQPALAIVPFAEGLSLEAARLIDRDAEPIASILEPAPPLEPGAFRDAIVYAALEREGVAGVLIAAK